MINNQEAIVYLSDTYKVELYKTLIFTGTAGFIGGLLNCKVQKYLNNILNNQGSSFLKILIQYLANGFFFSLGTVILVYSFFVSDPIKSMRMVETINKFSIPLAIIFPPMFTTITQIINKTIFRQNEK